MATSVYLSDLRYNYSGVLANDCMPLGVAYMKAVMDRELPEVQSRLFAYPQRLWESLRSAPPDVLMVSNYVWNQELSLLFARHAKNLRPDTLVVMGGPNIFIEDKRRLDFVKQHPEIDVYILGEGDFLAAEVVKQYLEVGESLSKLKEEELPSAVYRRPDGEGVIQPIWNRRRAIDDIPSPWLTGILDDFFDGKLAPLMETNRGCPFTCTFCVQGTDWYTKVNNFSVDRVREEIDYVGHRIKSICPSMGTLRIADPNYGMYERDVEISGYLGEAQKKYGWPTYIDATTGKNRADRIIKSLEKVNGALVLYQAVQSLDESVLKKVKRSTIKLSAYNDIMVHIRGRGMRSNSDLILGLPGETFETHVASIHKLLDAGVSQVTNFQLMMLKGSELETEESRRQFSFDVRFRALPKNFGVYGGEKVLDVDEIVVATDTLPFSDYIEARKYALVSVAFWHDDLLEDALRFASTQGVKRSEWLDAILPVMERDRGPLGRFLRDFVKETKNELFPSREACIAFYKEDENFERLCRGEIGENLMHQYHAIAVFHIWPAICKAGMDVIRELLVDKGIADDIPDFEGFWRDFHRWVELNHAHGYEVQEILSPVRAELTYDIAGWLAAGSPKDPSKFRLPEPRTYEFRLTEEGARELAKAFEVWTTSLRGLSKLVTRVQVAWQRRECHALHQTVTEVRV